MYAGHIQSGIPVALKVPADSQLLHRSFHLRPRSFSNTQRYSVQPHGQLTSPLISVLTFTAPSLPWTKSEMMRCKRKQRMK